MPLSRITSGSIEDGTIATADIAANAITTAKIGADVIVAEDVADNAITTAQIANDAVTADKIADSVSLGAGYYIANDGSVNGNANGRTNLFRVNSNATTGNVTIAANNNASVTGPLTIGNGTTLTITSTGRLAII
tara:strand:+ start:254 stop:658 length:405 start_codon:yes stop_codon:yes gene_type:complete